MHCREPRSLVWRHLVFDREVFYKSDKVVDVLKGSKVDLVVLAGFLWKVPSNLIQAYSGQIINIHPALLPKYGGKGMYGMNVHKAVIEAKEAESGITIHYVNEVYDDGEVIAQSKCKLSAQDDAESLAQKIHALEYEHFPKVIEEVIKKK